jgi:hypothetical protein
LISWAHRGARPESPEIFYPPDAPFCLDGSPDRITLRWKDNQTLAIECSACEENYGYADQNWGKLRFSYDLDKP